MTMQDDDGREIGGPSETRQSTVWARHVWSGLQLAYGVQQPKPINYGELVSCIVRFPSTLDPGHPAKEWSTQCVDDEKAACCWWLVERLWTASILMHKVDCLTKYRLRMFYDAMRPGTR